MTRRYRIAMVAACPLPYPRGTPIRIHHLANALVHRGHEVHVVTYHLGDRTAKVDYRLHRIPRVPTYRRLGPGPTYQKLLLLDPLLAIRLGRLLRSLAFDVVHAHHYEGLLTALAADAGLHLPLVFDAHTLLETELPFYPLGLSRRAKQRLGRWLDHRLPGRADQVIAVTDTIRDKLLDSGVLAPERISVIGNGVAWEHFDRPPEPAGSGRPAVRTAIFAGNLAAYQGIDLMLRAFAELLRLRRDVQLRIITESPFEPYAGLAGALGIQDRIEVVRASFAELPAHLAAADVALNPRVECDGVPQKVLNYMAAAKPIVSFAGSAKLLRHEDNALVVPDGDVAAFAGAVHRLLEDDYLAGRLGANARQLVRGQSWAAVAERVEAVYARLVSSGVSTSGVA